LGFNGIFGTDMTFNRLHAPVASASVVLISPGFHGAVVQISFNFIWMHCVGCTGTWMSLKHSHTVHHAEWLWIQSSQLFLSWRTP